MEPWYEKIPEIRTYNPNPKGSPDNPILSKRMSPLTNLFLNTFWNILERRNLIIAIPDTFLRPIPLLSYLYAYKQNKSVIVFTKKVGNEILYFKDYYLLNSGDYLFSKVPLGTMSENDINAKIYLPRATKRYYKRKYVETQKKRFLNRDEPKIFLYYDEHSNRISNAIEKITLDEGKLNDLNVDIEIGLVIFENIDRFVHSSYSSEIFLKWISSLLERNVRVIFHFSNPLSKYIQLLKERTDSFVLQFEPSFLRHNIKLKEASLSYFEAIPQEDREFLNKYNIDKPFFYTSITEIEMLSPPLLLGNIDEYYQRGRLLQDKINEEELVNKRQYYSLLNILFNLRNLSINPSKYKGSFYDPDLGYQHYTIPYMIKKIKEHISDEKTHNQVYLEDIISEIYCLYSELRECKRYGENGTYSRIAKDYQMLQLLNDNINCEKDDSHIILATYTRFSNERTKLKTETEKLGFDNGFDIEYIGRLSRQYFDRTKTTLILPGPLRLKHMPELFRPYHKIIMVTYDGKNYEIGDDQIDLFYTYSQQREDRAMSYLEEIYTDIGLHKDGLFRDYYDRKTDPKVEELEVTIEEDPKGVGGDPLMVRIRKLLSARNSQISREYLHDNEDAERIEQKITELEQEDDIYQIEETNEYYRVTLEKFDDSTRINRNLPVNKSYLYLKDMDDEVQEGYPTDFKINNFIVIIGNDERKTFLDTIIEIFGLEDSINKRLLTMWKEKLRNFIDTQSLSYAQGHRMFIENGGTISYPEFLNWVKGNVIGPDDPDDLVILGKMMDEEELIENHELINQEVEDLRNIHKITGRKVRKIIKELLRGELNQSELSFEEYMLYEQIHNNIYRIIEIEKMIKDEEDVK